MSLKRVRWDQQGLPWPRAEGSLRAGEGRLEIPDGDPEDTIIPLPPLSYFCLGSLVREELRLDLQDLLSWGEG